MPRSPRPVIFSTVISSFPESQPGKESEAVQSSLNIASNGDNTQNGNGQENNSQAQNSDANIRGELLI